MVKRKEQQLAKKSKPTYLDLVKKLLGGEPQHQPLGLPGWDGHASRKYNPGDLSDSSEQRVAVKICAVPGMTAERWAQLSVAERMPWLEEATAKSAPTPSAKRKPAQLSDSDWPTQADVARGFGWGPKRRMDVSRLCKDGVLRTNGESGRDCRVDPASILAYCKSEGLTWNET